MVDVWFSVLVAALANVFGLGLGFFLGYAWHKHKVLMERIESATTEKDQP